MRWNARRDHGSREGWLAARRIGASDVAKVLGVSSWGGPFEVWERITKGRPATPETAPQRRGHAWEPHVLALYAVETGADVRRPPPFSTWDGPDAWATASPDAFAQAGGEWGLVEAKTTNTGGWPAPCTIGRWDPSIGLRSDYALQCYAQAHVLDAPWVDLAVLLPFYELRVYRLVRDLEVEAAIVETLDDWWDRHVVGGEAPAIDGSNAATRHVLSLRDQFPPAKRASRPARPEELQLAGLYAQAHKAEEWASREKRRIGQLLVASAADASRLDLRPGSRAHVSIVRNAGRRTLDETALVADHPELAPVLDRYRRQGEPSIYPRIYGLEDL